MNELIHIVAGCLAWIALCGLACIAVCAVVYTQKPEDHE